MSVIENTRWITSQLLERAAMLRGGLVVFMYHRVCEPEDGAFLQKSGVPFVTPGVFREQLEFLSSRKFRVFSFREALERLEEGRPFPPRSALITFDDGYRDNLTEAAPALAEHDYSAVVFVATRVLEQRELLWEHRVLWALEHLGPERFRELAGDLLPLGKRVPGPWIVLDLRGPGLETRARLGERLGRAIESAEVDEAALAGELYLSGEDLDSLLDLGIDVGSHGAAHQPLTVMNRREKETDLAEAHDVLHGLLGDRQLPVYCSPYGSHRRVDRELLEERGYRAATSVLFGTNSRRTDRYFLRRVSLGEQSWHRLRFLDRFAGLAARIDGGHGS